MRGATILSSALLAGLLFAGSPSSVEARQADETGQAEGDTLQLTLSEAVDRARLNNPGFRQSTNNLELNELDGRSAWLELLPQPQINLLSTSMNWSRQAVAEDFFGDPIEREDQGTVHTSRSNQSFGATFSLNLGQFLEMRQQEVEARQRELTVESEGRGLRADVGQAFLDVQEQQAALALEEELLEAARLNRDLVQRLYALAQRDRIDLVTLELDLAEQENALEESRAELETGRLTLRNLIGDPDLGPFEIVPQPLELFDPTRLDEEALVEAATRSSPQIRQAEAGLEVNRRAANLNRAQWLPTLNFSWYSTRQGFVRGSEAFFDPNPDVGWDRRMSVGISFPDIGQYFTRQNDQRRNEIQIQNGTQELRRVRGEVEQEIRTLASDLRSSYRSLEIQERRAELAEERLELAREAYRLGGQTYLELQTAQEQAAEARRQAITAQFSFERARIALERAMGMPVEDLLELDGEG